MVLCLKARESRSLPGLPSAKSLFLSVSRPRETRERQEKRLAGFDAGWSSPEARQAHNLKVVGSNPAPATILTDRRSVADKAARNRAAFLLSGARATSTIAGSSPTCDADASIQSPANLRV